MALTAVMMAGFSVVTARAQDLNGGKSPAQLFATGCRPCHDNPRGLGKRLGGATLVNYLRQHYTTSREQAAVLATYVASLATEAPGATQRPAAASREQVPRPEAQQQAPPAGARRAPRSAEEGRPAPGNRPAAGSRQPADAAAQRNQPVSPAPGASAGAVAQQPADVPTAALPAIPASEPTIQRTDDIAD